MHFKILETKESRCFDHYGCSECLCKLRASSAYFWMHVPRLGCGNILITNCFVSSVPFCSCALYTCIVGCFEHIYSGPIISVSRSIEIFDFHILSHSFMAFVCIRQMLKILRKHFMKCKQPHSSEGNVNGCHKVTR